MILGGVVAAALVVVLVAFALTTGGDEVPASIGDDPGGGPSSPGSTAADPTAAEPTRTPEPTATEPPLPYRAGEIVEMSSDLSSLAFKVVYEMAVVEEESGTEVSGTMTISSVPPSMTIDIDFGPAGLVLDDLIAETDDQEATPAIERIVIIVDGDTAFICLKAVDPPEASCTASPVEDDPEAEPGPETVGALIAESLRLLEEDGEGTIVAAAPDVIAGRPVRCFAILRAETTEDLTSDLDIRICLDTETGIPLYMEGIGSGAGSVDTGGSPDDAIGADLLVNGTARATALVFDVGAEDFVPPFEVVADE